MEQRRERPAILPAFFVSVAMFGPQAPMQPRMPLARGGGPAMVSRNKDNRLGFR
jgi:hypothetical protein